MTAPLKIRKAQRKKAKLRMALCGPSGSGKTYSALLIAFGLGGKIAVIDTENCSADYYAHLGEFDVLDLTPPYSPQRYIEAIEILEKAGYNVIIIDSLSHAWSGEGGVLDMHNRTARQIKNNFVAWRDITPLHNKLVEKILNSPAHIIATIRTKTEYVYDESNKKVQKLGMAPIQRDGLEYEFTVFGEINHNHVLTITKDRTGKFQDMSFVPTRQFGVQLKEWLESGEEIKEQPKEQMEEQPEEKPEFKVLPGGRSNPESQKETGTLRGTVIEAQRDKAKSGKDYVAAIIKTEAGNVKIYAADENLTLADAVGAVVEVQVKEQGKSLVATNYRFL